MKNKSITHIFNKKYILSLIIVFSIFHCAYYNTFFNAEENYRIGLEKKNNSKSAELSKDIKTNFEKAINKSWKVIDVYGDSSSWADDALLLIGKSHYQLNEFNKSQEILKQFLQKYLKSPLKSEAELWLAKTYVEQADSDEALKSFTTLISTATDDDILADAYFNIGEIYFNSKDYDQAIINYQKSIDLTSSSEKAGNAQYKLADSYFNQGDYEKAMVNYKKVLQYDLPTIKQYDAVVQTANSLIKLKQFDQAQEMLHNMLNDQRFKDYYSMIATKLANMIEFQGDKKYALEKYYDVLDQYPKTEGAALASFYIAQIYEFDYGWMDSAKVKYDNVAKEDRNSESVKEANERSRILKTYLDLRHGINKDKEDIFKLEHGDSSLVDSIVTGQDTVLVHTKPDTSKSEQNINEEEENDAASVFQEVLRRRRNPDQAENQNEEQQIKEKKAAVTRKPQEVRKSLLKNSFNIAEFFLLNYQHYDSARAAYENFIKNFSDSLLTPKAYYSLYYIYHDIYHDSLKADSVKNIILTKYTDTLYGKKLSGKSNEEIVIKNPEFEKMFLHAEDMVDKKKYDDAISLYKKVAISDSGSTWAVKSRYAIAYIYENYLKNMHNAITSYEVLAKEYPSTEQGSIAKKKIAEPPAEKKESKTMPADTSMTAPADTLKTSRDLPTIPESEIKN